MQIITPEVLNARMSETPVQLVDVRSPAEYARGHAKGAVNIPLDRLSTATLADFDLKAPIYLICKSGTRSHMGVCMLHSYGVMTAVNVTGGTDRWLWAGLPIEAATAGALIG